MLTQSLQRWLNIETALGYCTVFCDCSIVMRVTLSIPVQETPDNMIHWPNADANCKPGLPSMTLGQHYSN